MPELRRIATFVLLAGCGGGAYAGPIYVWSDDGACGVPPGYVGLDETPTQDGGCRAATWCPLDSSPACLTPEAGPPPASDGGAGDAEP